MLADYEVKVQTHPKENPVKLYPLGMMCKLETFLVDCYFVSQGCKLTKGNTILRDIIRTSSKDWSENYTAMMFCQRTRGGHLAGDNNFGIFLMCESCGIVHPSECYIDLVGTIPKLYHRHIGTIDATAEPVIRGVTLVLSAVPRLFECSDCHHRFINAKSFNFHRANRCKNRR